MSAVGILHPGEMGAAFGTVLRAAGHSVLWVSAGRSEATRARASAAGLDDAGSLDELMTRCGVVLSICPPHAALGLAESLPPFDGIFVDANAIAGRRRAAWTKGSGALLLAIRAFARAENIEPALLEEWAGSFPELEARTDAARRSADAKGWRWVGEMEEIAAAFAADGLPSGFHEAAAEVYRQPS